MKFHTTITSQNSGLVQLGFKGFSCIHIFNSSLITKHVEAHPSPIAHELANTIFDLVAAAETVGTEVIAEMNHCGREHAEPNHIGRVK